MAEARQYDTEAPAPRRGPGSRGAGRGSFAEPRRKPPRLSGRNPYSVFVGLLKVLLPALAVALILLVLVWPQLQQDDDRFRVGVTELAPERADGRNMINARFEGVDDKNRPFTVTADVATQAEDDPDIVDLQLPKSDMALQDGAWVALTARHGRYHRDSKLLELSGDVSLFHDRGFELHTSAAVIDLEAGTARGDQPVAGQGPSGTLRAEGFRMTRRGKRILFTGDSRLVLFPERAEAP